MARGARVAALAGSIPTRGPRIAHVARRSVAGGPVRLSAAGGPVRPRAAGGPAPASLAAGGGALAAHAPALGCPAAGAGESAKPADTAGGGRELWAASPGGALGTLRAGNVRPRPLRAATEPGPGRGGCRLLSLSVLGPAPRAPAELRRPSGRPAAPPRLPPLHSTLRAAAPAPALPTPRPKAKAARRRCENAESQHRRPRSRGRAGGAGRRRPSSSAIGWSGGAGAERDWWLASWGGTWRGRDGTGLLDWCAARLGSPPRSGRSGVKERGAGGRRWEVAGREAGAGGARRRARAKKKRNNEEKKQCEHHGWNGPLVSRAT